MVKGKAAEKSSSSSTDAAISSPSFEEAIVDLQQIVTDLESNSLGLEASLAQFERGIGLLRQCHAFLDQAEQKIEILLSFKSDGEVQTAPFDATPTAGGTDSKTLF